MKQVCFTSERLLDYATGLIAGNDFKDMQKHIQNCERCLKEVAEIKETRKLLRILKPMAGETADCLSDDQLIGYLNGMQTTAQHLEHASICDFCRGRQTLLAEAIKEESGMAIFTATPYAIRGRAADIVGDRVVEDKKGIYVTEKIVLGNGITVECVRKDDATDDLTIIIEPKQESLKLTPVNGKPRNITCEGDKSEIKAVRVGSYILEAAGNQYGVEITHSDRVDIAGLLSCIEYKVTKAINADELIKGVHQMLVLAFKIIATAPNHLKRLLNDYFEYHSKLAYGFPGKRSVLALPPDIDVDFDRLTQPLLASDMTDEMAKKVESVFNDIKQLLAKNIKAQNDFDEIKNMINKLGDDMKDDHVVIQGKQDQMLSSLDGIKSIINDNYLGIQELVKKSKGTDTDIKNILANLFHMALQIEKVLHLSDLKSEMLAIQNYFGTDVFDQLDESSKMALATGLYVWNTGNQLKSPWFDVSVFMTEYSKAVENEMRLFLSNRGVRAELKTLADYSNHISNNIKKFNDVKDLPKMLDNLRNIRNGYAHAETISVGQSGARSKKEETEAYCKQIFTALFK